MQKLYSNKQTYFLQEAKGWLGSPYHPFLKLYTEILFKILKDS
jgi:hypothetical protein